MEQVKRVKEVKEDLEVVVKQKRGRRRTEEEVSVMVEEEEEENTPMMVSNNPHLPTVVIKPRMMEKSSKMHSKTVKIFSEEFGRSLSGRHV